MWRGPEPGNTKYEITWKKVSNTITERMQDESLIHLFTERRRLRRRTKLLNNHLRRPANRMISYPDYIKAKTAILRTLSEDEETNDSDSSDDLFRPHEKGSTPKACALRTLLEDMMLKSPGSTDESEPRIEVVTKRKRGRPRGSFKNRVHRRKKSDTSASESEWGGRNLDVSRRQSARIRNCPSEISKTAALSNKRKKDDESMAGRQFNSDKSAEESIDDFQSSVEELKRVENISRVSNGDGEPDKLEASVVREGKNHSFPGRKLRLGPEERDSNIDDSGDSDSSGRRISQCGNQEYSTTTRINIENKDSSDELDTTSKTVIQNFEFVDVDSLRRKFISKPISGQDSNIEENTLKSPDKPRKSGFSSPEVVEISPERQYKKDVKKIGTTHRIKTMEMSRMNNKKTTNDATTHIYEKISKMITNGVDPHLAADASRIYFTDSSINGQETPAAYTTDEGEFMTPHTSDCEQSEDEDNKKWETIESTDDISLKSGENKSRKNSVDGDDIFEKEEIIIQPELNVVESDMNREDPETSPGKNALACQNDFLHEDKHLDAIDTNGFSQISTSDSTFHNETEEQKNDFVDTDPPNLTAFSQEFDARNGENIKDIEEYVENVVKEFDKKIAAEIDSVNDSKPNLVAEASRKSTPESNQSITRKDSPVNEENYEKRNINNPGDSNKLTGKASVSSPSIVGRSPKTPKEVKRNLMTVLDEISRETPPGTVEKTKNTSSPIKNGIETRNLGISSSDGEFGILDSGIDEDSPNPQVSPQEYPESKEEEGNNSRERIREFSPKMPVVPKEKKTDKTEDKTEVITPSKKIANVKITCTEVVKSKYMIVKSQKTRAEEKLSSTEAPLSPREIIPRSEGTTTPERFTKYSEEPEEEEDDQDDECRPYHRVTEYRFNFPSFRDQLNDYNSDEQEYNALDPEHSVFHEEDEWERSKREERMSLAVASETESLRYVLNTLAARANRVDDWYEDEANVLQEEIERENSEGLRDVVDPELSEILTRPTSIPEFIEGSDLVPSEAVASFTLGDIGEDDDIYLMEIPKSILERNLEGQRLRLGERKIIIGEGRYEVQRKDSEPMSCIMNCGDARNRYKTGIIEPVDNIVVRQHVRDDVITRSKIGLESRMSVPFPRNIKSRNPLVLGGQGDSDQLESGNIKDAFVNDDAIDIIDEKPNALKEEITLECIKSSLGNDDEERMISRRKKKRKKHDVFFEGPEDIQRINNDFEKTGDLMEESTDVDGSQNQSHVDHGLTKKSKKLRKLSSEKETLGDENNSDGDMREEKFIERMEMSGDIKSPSVSGTESKTEVRSKKKVKILRRLFCKEESLIDIENNSKADVKYEEQYISTPESFPTAKKNKKSKKRKKMYQEEEMFHDFRDSFSAEVKENSGDSSDVSRSDVELNCKAKKRKERHSVGLHEYKDVFNVGNGDLLENESETINESKDEIKIPRKSFYDQMIEDSD